ncbi:MAG: aminoacyl-tRNA hydrolase [bacterium]|nr:aminoacyl-tRNA hydrolase [bacterium]
MISLIIGLGNIGKKYHHTRHNVGFDVVDSLIGKNKATQQPRVKEFDWATFEEGERKIILAKPRTFMNLSGLAAARLLEENELTPSQMLVIVDDFAIPLGTVRIRGKGSAGGHNGLTSIMEELGTQAFPRIRMGIGKVTPQMAPSELGRQTSPSAPVQPKPVDNEADIVDFVLSPFEPEERPVVDKMILHATEAVLFAIAHRLDQTMSKYNVNPALPENL